MLNRFLNFLCSFRFNTFNVSFVRNKKVNDKLFNKTAFISSHLYYLMVFAHLNLLVKINI